ncbi:terminase gpP N-terminus-related DNA-binding protein [Veillonella atypica]
MIITITRYIERNQHETIRYYCSRYRWCNHRC